MTIADISGSFSVRHFSFYNLFVFHEALKTPFGSFDVARITEMHAIAIS